MAGNSANVLLVVPAAPDTFGRREERLGVSYLAGILSHVGHNVRVLDSQAILGQSGYREDAGCIDSRKLKHEFNDLALPLLERDWDVIGFSVLSCEVRSCAQLVRHLRSEGSRAHVTLGGETPTIELPWIFDEIPGIDSIVLGEGELTLLELVDSILHGKDWHKVAGLAWREGGQVRQSPGRPVIQDLDVLPHPDRQTLPAMKNWLPMANITSSRDCFFRCTFCSVRRFWEHSSGGWRVRRVAGVVREIADVQQRFGVDNFTFTDPLWMGAGGAGRRNVRAFAEELIKRDLGIHFRVKVRADSLNAESLALLKRAGLDRVGIGVESVWQPTLDAWKKDESAEDNIAGVNAVFDADVDLDLGFIMFHPYTTMDEFDANLRFLRDVLGRAPRPDLTMLYTYYTKLIPFRGTEVYEELARDNLLNAQGNYAIQDPQAAEVYQVLWDHIRPSMRPLYYPLIQWELIAKRLRMDGKGDAQEREFGDAVRGLSITLADVCEALSQAVRQRADASARIRGEVERLGAAVRDVGARATESLRTLGFADAEISGVHKENAGNGAP